MGLDFKRTELVRLDSPVTGQTYLGEEVPIKFWALCEGELKLDEIEYEIIAEEVTPVPSHIFLGTNREIVLYSSKEGVKGEFSFIYAEGERKENTYPIFSSETELPIVEFSGVVKRREGVSGTFIFKVRVIGAGVCEISNKVQVSFSNSEEFLQRPLGGPLTILPEYFFGKVLVLRGWIFKAGTRVQKIVPHISGGEKYFVRHSLKFEELRGALPDLLEIEDSGVELVVLLRDSKYPYRIDISLEVLFEDGDKKIFPFGGTLVSPSVEKAFILREVASRGENVLISGILSGPVGDDYTLSLLGSRSQYLVDSRNVQERVLEHGNGILDSSYYDFTFLKEISFAVPRTVLGHNPGSVDLEVSCRDGAKVDLLGSDSRAQLSLVFNSGVNLDSSFIKKAYRFFAKKGLSPVKSLRRELLLPKKESKGILFVAHNYNLTEGAPKVLQEIMNGIDFDVPRSVLSLQESSFLDGVREKNIPVVVNDKLSQVGFTEERFFEGVKELGRFFAEHRPRVIVANSVDSFPVVAAALDEDISVIWVIHESVRPEEWYDRLSVYLKQRFLFSLNGVKKLVFVSESTRDLYREFVSRERGEVIRNGIDSDSFSRRVRSVDRDYERFKMGCKDGEIVLLSVGTTTERKGQDRTIRELAVLRSKYPQVKFRMLFVGAREIPALFRLRQSVERLGLEDVVEFVPETEDVYRYYAVADYFILNSKEESSPLVVLEAFSIGLPVLSTNVFGLKELVLDNETGIVFDGNREGDLVDGLVKLIGDEELRTRVVDNARKMLKSGLDISKMRERYSKLIGSFASN